MFSSSPSQVLYVWLVRLLFNGRGLPRNVWKNTCNKIEFWFHYKIWLAEASELKICFFMHHYTLWNAAAFVHFSAIPKGEQLKFWMQSNWIIPLFQLSRKNWKLFPLAITLELLFCTHIPHKCYLIQIALSSFLFHFQHTQRICFLYQYRRRS